MGSRPENITRSLRVGLYGFQGKYALPQRQERAAEARFDQDPALTVWDPMRQYSQRWRRLVVQTTPCRAEPIQAENVE
jgi:hypothetical protein